MAQIPLLKTGNQAMDLWQTRVKSQIDPLLSNKIIQGDLVQDASLSPGSNTITHNLGKIPVGWIVVDINASANVWRSADFDKDTLTLTSSAAGPIIVSLWVF